jgi:hypothetical protein
MVGDALNLASKFTAKAISSLVLFSRYIGAPVAHGYRYSDPNTFSPSSYDQNGSISFSKAFTTRRVLDE